MNYLDLRWIEPFAYKAGAPFRIFPVGEFKRDGRAISLTVEKLREFAENLQQGRPRWKPPIYLGHPTEAMPDPPKVGNVVELLVRPDGLYAVPEFNAEGERVLAEGAYQYNSPGVIWSGYRDEYGNNYPNILDHLALTNKPWMGSRTQIFSEVAIPEPETFTEYFTAVLANDFGGDSSKAEAAYMLAGERRPDLFAEYWLTRV